MKTLIKITAEPGETVEALIASLSRFPGAIITGGGILSYVSIEMKLCADTPETAPDASPGEAAPEAEAQPDPPPPRKAPVAGKRRAYSDDEKAAAVRLADEIGPKKASEQTGITDTIINRWRRESRGNSAVVSEPVKDVDSFHPSREQAIETTRRSNPIERSPHAGQGAMVPTGIRTPVDEDKARRAAFT